MKIDLMVNDAMLHWSASRYQEAHECLDKILEEDPTNTTALGMKGRLLDEEGLRYNKEILFEQAKRCYEKILKLDPYHIHATIDLADYWSRKEKFDKAIPLYNKAIQILEASTYEDVNEDLEDAYYAKLNALEEMQEYEKLKSDLKRVLCLLPDSELFKGLRQKYLERD